MNKSLFLLFDLDYTLWPFYTNLLSDSQFTNLLTTFEFSDDIKLIFDYIKKTNMPFGIISRSKYPNRCRLLLQKLGISLDSIPNIILWTPNKTKLPHLQNLISKYNIDKNKNSFILYDDDIENLNSVKEIVTAGVLVNKNTCLTFDQFVNAVNNLL